LSSQILDHQKFKELLLRRILHENLGSIFIENNFYPNFTYLTTDHNRLPKPHPLINNKGINKKRKERKTGQLENFLSW
jgi:hypothetical protein